MKKRLDIDAISVRVRARLQFLSERSSQPHRRIIAVGNVKGAVGKTTLAVNLTICEAQRGNDVLLVDGDEQGTARAFTQLRAENLGTPGYTTVSLRGAAKKRGLNRSSWIRYAATKELDIEGL